MVAILLMYIIFIFKSKDEKRDMMCLEKCNMKDCDYCIDKEQYSYGRRKTKDVK